MKKNLTRLVLSLLAVVIWLPLALTVFWSLADLDEILECFRPVFQESEENLIFRLFPLFPTLRSYVELLLDSPGFFVMFWNSCRQVFPILAGQMLVGIPAAFAMARFSFPGRGALRYLYIILMILPFQVTMASSYLVLDRISCLDTHWAVILPGIFATFPVFLITKSFEGIPEVLFEAARIDGAGEFKAMWSIGIPLAMPGILSALVLGFLEYWNALEQPMTFLKSPKRWPLSLYLPNITADKMGVSFTASVIMMLPAVLLFLWGQEFLEEGIAASGLKE